MLDGKKGGKSFGRKKFMWHYNFCLISISVPWHSGPLVIEVETGRSVNAMGRYTFKFLRTRIQVGEQAWPRIKNTPWDSFTASAHNDFHSNTCATSHFREILRFCRVMSSSFSAWTFLAARQPLFWLTKQQHVASPSVHFASFALKKSPFRICGDNALYHKAVYTYYLRCES